MATQTQQGNLQRKSILMPPEMISEIDKIARGRSVSFAQVVREAVDAFDETLAMVNMGLLEALADTMIQTTHDLVKKSKRSRSGWMRHMHWWRINSGRHSKSDGGHTGWHALE